MYLSLYLTDLRWMYLMLMSIKYDKCATLFSFHIKPLFYKQLHLYLNYLKLLINLNEISLYNKLLSCVNKHLFIVTINNCHHRILICYTVPNRLSSLIVTVMHKVFPNGLQTFYPMSINCIIDIGLVLFHSGMLLITHLYMPQFITLHKCAHCHTYYKEKQETVVGLFHCGTNTVASCFTHSPLVTF